MKLDNLREKTITLMKNGHICDNCLGRGFAELLTGMSNDERGRILRLYLAFLIDSGENIEVDHSNFHGIEFRHVKLKPTTPKPCSICGDFFSESISHLAEEISKKLSSYEFDSFLIGTVVSSKLIGRQEKAWMESGIEFVEPIRREINRELGKKGERLTGKRADLETPDITIIADLEKNQINLQVSSILIYGKYQKLARGISQSIWICKSCNGKGCVKCSGEGKVYKTSIQEIIGTPMIKSFKAKRTKFHGSGREDVDVRCLGKRPFIIEMLRPKVRKSDLKKLQSIINKSKKVKVFGLKFASKVDIHEVKTSKYDKTYLAEVTFESDVDKERLKAIGKLNDYIISQRTPRRVAHRRADKIRKRSLVNVKYKLLGKKRVEFKMRGESGLYIKELISGDDGRTNPNFSDLLDNKVKNIKLDVIKVHTK